MNDKVETITIKGSDGQPLRINASDFDISKHELWTDAVDGKQEAPKNEGDAGNNGQPAPSGSPAPAAPPAGAPAPKAATK